MNYYLLIYDRKEGKLIKEPKEYSSEQRQEAWKDRLDFEIKNQEEDHIESVVFGAKSLEDLKKTHGRYFFNYNANRNVAKKIRQEINKLKKM